MTIEEHLSDIADAGWRQKRLCERIIAKVQVQENGCWKWTAAYNAYGYGVIRVQGKTLRAHRVLYTLIRGEIPEGKQLLHSCDNRWCVCLDHLRVGTHRENMEDMRDRGRCGQAKIDLKTAEAIKVDLFRGELTCAEIGNRYNLHKSSVMDIKGARSWKHASLLQGLFQDINDAQWLINNLFQRNDGLWQANLRNATEATQWGLGRTACEALLTAFDNMHNTVPLSDTRVNACIDPTGIKPALREVPSLESLLRKPATKLVRRF